MKLERFAAWMAVSLVVAPVAVAAKDHVTVDVTWDAAAGKPAVGEEPINSTPDEEGFVWKIATPGYRFADQGITIKPGGRHVCHLKNPTTVRCGKLGHKAGETYHYTVRIVRDGRSEPAAVLDPTIKY
ncbi:MAG TPA: hypothetical protein VMU33_00495 [Burkholderiaceae bacterium]|nr:hypothetical protein [Burkholderiaceae bacterium]